jgi:hypothetical protein
VDKELNQFLHPERQAQSLNGWMKARAGSLLLAVFGCFAACSADQGTCSTAPPLPESIFLLRHIDTVIVHSNRLNGKSPLVERQLIVTDTVRMKP